MKRIIIILLLFCTPVFSQNINWYADGDVYTTTTCEDGADIILPQTPTKKGYAFKGWKFVTPIEYLESTGTQYIDTGYKLQTENIKMEIRFVKLDYDSGAIIGTSNTRQDSNWFTIYFNTSSFLYAIGTTSSGQKSFSLYTLTDVKLETFSNHSFISTVNGNITNGTWNGSFLVTTMGNVLLYSMPYGTGHATWNLSARIYSAKIYDNDILVRDMVPVLDSDGIPCMYDKVTNQIFYNNGTGQFIAGPVVETNL